MSAGKRDKFKNLKRGVDQTEPPAEYKTEAIGQIIGGTSETSSAEINKESTPMTSTEDVNDGGKQDMSNVDVNTTDTSDTSNTDMDNKENQETSDGYIKGGSTDGTETLDIAGFAKAFEQQVKERQKMEDIYSRHTFLIRNDLLKRLEKTVKKKPRGFKTQLINKLLETALDQLE